MGREWLIIIVNTLCKFNIKLIFCKEKQNKPHNVTHDSGKWDSSNGLLMSYLVLDQKIACYYKDIEGVTIIRVSSILHDV